MLTQTQNQDELNIYLTTMENFAMINEAYDGLFERETKPVNPPSGTWLSLDAKGAGLVLLSTSFPWGPVCKLSGLPLQTSRGFQVEESRL
jgi:hypothetical protein